MNTLEREAVRLTAMLAATENFAPSYSNTPEQHAQLIKAEAELQLVLTKFFKNMQSKVHDFVNWQHYEYQVGQNRHNTLDRQKLDYNIDVIVNDEQIDNNDTPFIKLTLKTIEKATKAGFIAAELAPKAPTLGLPGVNAIIQNLSTKHVASLVGKKVLKDGSIVDNPNTAYNIMDTVRNDIATSIKTSLGLGETTDEAVQRMSDIIDPVDRAELIAQTESVNAYNAGLMEFGNQSDAVGKEWETAGAEDECADNEAEGPIPFDDDFVSGDSEPTAHPRCRCALRLIYQEEWDAGGYG
jgi:hypothetical protein